MPPNNLYPGLAQTGPSINEVLTHGDHGLGTVAHLNGELIIVDGEGYHLTPDNQPRKVTPADRFPFMMVTQFRPTVTKQLASLTMPTLHTALSPLLPSKQNCFLSVRVDGLFHQVAFRVIPAQSTAREPLSELAKRQQFQSVQNVQGLLFGFWSPAFSNGFSVAGFHLHFISDDRTAGGHVTGFDTRDATLSAAVLKEYQVEMPQHEEFHEVPIRNFASTDLYAAEGH
ncbi:hypothetical protein BBP40_003909 [Aspergillus hancockii]|nr:hypothetical protein BBP40_003909 [Aspergillus hancockii]